MIVNLYFLINAPKTQWVFATWVFFVILYLFIDIFTIIHILKNKHHEPVSALLWIFIVVELNYIGLIMYLFLGINRINTKGVKVNEAHRAMHAMRNSPGSLSEYLHKIRAFHYTGNKGNEHSYLSILDKLQASTYPIFGNKIELLEDGTSAYPKMFEAIKSAKYHIHLQSYIIMNDEVGKQLFDMLEQKAKSGVIVKVLFDRMGSAKAYKSHFFKHWATKIPNLDIKPFSTINLFAPYRIQLRNHRKLLIVDGKIAFIGGINISSDNDRRINKNKYIHDLHCRIEGPVIGEFQYTFLRDWCFVSKIDPIKILEINRKYFRSPVLRGESIIRVNSSGPGQAFEASEKLFMTAITSAKDYVWIITPYFVPDKSFIYLLRMAAARNVDVKIIIPQNNNHWYVRYATTSLYNTLLRSNIRIYEKKGAFSHVKAMMIDGEWATMGSSNCDNRSFRLNYELDFSVEGGEFIRDLHDQFIKEISESVEITMVDRLNRSTKEELLEAFCSLLTPIL